MKIADGVTPKEIEMAKHRAAIRRLEVEAIDISKDEDGYEYLDITYKTEVGPFDRIRRITGYLVGTLDRWNDAKRAEEHDRVKHGVE